jgi:hypothetical protein
MLVSKWADGRGIKFPDRSSTIDPSAMLDSIGMVGSAQPVDARPFPPTLPDEPKRVQDRLKSDLIVKE